jgi:hypothetical protein
MVTGYGLNNQDLIPEQHSGQLSGPLNRLFN